MTGKDMPPHLVADAKGAFNVYELATPQLAQVGALASRLHDIETGRAMGYTRSRKADAVDGDRRAKRQAVREIAEMDGNGRNIAPARNVGNATNALYDASEDGRKASVPSCAVPLGVRFPLLCTVATAARVSRRISSLCYGALRL